MILLWSDSIDLILFQYYFMVYAIVGAKVIYHLNIEQWMKTFITSNPALWIPSINMVVLLISWCKLMKLSDFLPCSLFSGPTVFVTGWWLINLVPRMNISVQPCAQRCCADLTVKLFMCPLYIFIKVLIQSLKYSLSLGSVSWTILLQVSRKVVKTHVICILLLYRPSIVVLDNFDFIVVFMCITKGEPRGRILWRNWNKSL